MLGPVIPARSKLTSIWGGFMPSGSKAYIQSVLSSVPVAVKKSTPVTASGTLNANPVTRGSGPLVDVFSISTVIVSMPSKLKSTMPVLSGSVSPAMLKVAATARSLAITHIAESVAPKKTPVAILWKYPDFFITRPHKLLTTARTRTLSIWPHPTTRSHCRHISRAIKRNRRRSTAGCGHMGNLAHKRANGPSMATHSRFRKQSKRRISRHSSLMRPAAPHLPK